MRMIWRKLPAFLMTACIAAALVLVMGATCQGSHAATTYTLSPQSITTTLIPGQSMNVTVKLIKNPGNTTMSNVTFRWEYDPADLEIKGPSGSATAKGSSVKFTIKRLKNVNTAFTLVAETASGYRTENNYFMKQVTTNLQDYHINFIGSQNSWRYFVQEGGSVPESKVDVRADDGNIVPKNVYDLKVQKYDHYEEATGQEVFVDAAFPLTHEPKGTIQDDDDVGGTSVYRVTAVAKDGSGFSGQTPDYGGYIVICSVNTLHFYASDVDLGQSNRRIADDEPYLRYEFKLGQSFTPVVKVNNKKLVAGKDFQAVYTNIKTGAKYTSVPKVAGSYTLTVKGINSYYNLNPNTWIKIGPANTLNVKVSPKTKKFKAKKLKKKAQTYSPLKVTGAKGKVTYTVVGGNAKSKAALKVNATNGKVTVAKKTKKGTYSIKVRVEADGVKTPNIFGSKTVTVKVKVKK